MFIPTIFGSGLFLPEKIKDPFQVLHFLYVMPIQRHSQTRNGNNVERPKKVKQKLRENVWSVKKMCILRINRKNDHKNCIIEKTVEKIGNVKTSQRKTQIGRMKEGNQKE